MSLNLSPSGPRKLRTERVSHDWGSVPSGGPYFAFIDFPLKDDEIAIAATAPGQVFPSVSLLMFGTWGQGSPWVSPRGGVVGIAVNIGGPPVNAGIIQYSVEVFSLN